MACDFFTMETVQLKTLYGEPVPVHPDEIWRRDLLAGFIHEDRGIAA
jgi:hypothetical protein